MTNIRRSLVVAEQIKETNLAKWMKRLLPTWFFQVPESVDKDDEKIYLTRLTVMVIAALLHGSLVVVYLAIDIPWVAVVNIGSILIFGIGIWLIKSGRQDLGMFIGLFEASIHIPLSTYLLGPGAGYLMFYFIFAAIAVLVYRPTEPVKRTLVVATAALSTIVMVTLTRNLAPVIEMEPWKLNSIHDIIAGGTFISLAVIAFHFATVTNTAEKRIKKELERADELLRNILPDSIADRLKSSPNTISDNIESATILFCDIVGFTKLASQKSANQIVDMLDDIFSTFDQLALTYKVEKIKTIGDAYMVVGGVPEKTEPRVHVKAITDMALEMIEAVNQYAKNYEVDLNIRVGIHTGPVVAGVIGMKKFTYDLWGDTVNIASRMESHGEKGRIQISENTQKLLPNSFELEERGVISIKNRGHIKTWFVGKQAGL